MSYYPSQPPATDDRSLKDLISELSSQLSALLRNEVELAKVELQDQASRAAKAGVMFGAGAAAAFFAAMLFSFAAAWGLGEVIPVPIGFLIVGLVYAVAAAVLIGRGRGHAGTIGPPKKTVQTLKQDVEVAKVSISRGMSGNGRPEPLNINRPWDNTRR